MTIVILLLPAFLAGFLAWFLASSGTPLIMRLAVSRGAVSHPNERSSHAEPTPRLGGLALIGGALIPLFLYVLFAEPIQRMQGFTDIDEISWLLWAGFFAASGSALALGLVDDLRNLPAILKLIGQVAIAGIAAGFGLIVHQLYIPYVGIVELHPLVGGALAAFWMLLMMNAVNFMDGINGLAGRFMEVAGIALLVSTINVGWRTEFVVLGGVMIGAAAGFLAYNRGEKARTFMGDCGSQALGALFAGAVLLLHNDRPVAVTWSDTPLHAPFLFGLVVAWPFVFDVVYTLIRRAAAGKKIWTAHREHLYQRHLAATGENHERTLNFVSNLLYASAVAGILSIRTSPDPRLLDPLRLAILAGLVILAGIYFANVRAKENEPVTASDSE